MTATLWTDEERRAWAPPEELTVSEWADRYRVLTDRESSEPGQWRTVRAPYLREIMDALGDPDRDTIVISKPAQMGVSEATRNGIGYWVAQDPGPCLLVYPSELSCKEQVEERLKPLVSATLTEHKTDTAADIKLTKLSLTSMDIFVGWATSPQRLASRPIRYVIFDEVNKYPEWSAKDADPIALGRARTKTWGRRGKVVILSTPTIPDGHVTQALEKCEELRRYVIPCASCGAEIDPTWSCVVWPDRPDDVDTATHAARIKAESLARLRCPECREEMTEAQRVAALRHGRWNSSLADGVKARSVGFSFSSLVSPWARLSDLAAKFLTAKDRPAALMEFVNQDLGEVFVEQQDRVEDEDLERKAAAGLPPGVVPEWAGAVIAGADTQKDGFWYVVRAVGRGCRSRLIDCGHARTLEELRRFALDRPWPIADSELTMTTAMLCIDARGGISAGRAGADRTDQVLRWSMSDARIRPMMGTARQSTSTQPISVNNTQYTPHGAPSSYRVMRYTVDVGYWKDVLASRIRHEDDELWELCSSTPAEYLRQMTAEHKVLQKRGGELRMVWRTKSAGADNHFWDCEVYVTAGMVLGDAEHLPDVAELRKQRRQMASVDRIASDEDRARGDGWVNGNGWWS